MHRWLKGGRMPLFVPITVKWLMTIMDFNIFWIPEVIIFVFYAIGAAAGLQCDPIHG